MILTYHSKFKKDLEKLKDKKTKATLLKKILELKNASNLEEVNGIKKLKNHPNAYRGRIRDYRLGFYLLDKNTASLQRFVKRNDIYKLFP
ncbi:plasmid stabilization protein [Salegentibacter salegens]|uniref:mRNA-degrading endonuclease RelE, toxin component of the RelBE toxin-antitoxin system n=1 Tax=Salegentibacter salegens TaxID=143223 RepID=A0A1M7M8C1_9FLAO|nr:plasmid stabilization protein [Salegentibacter salegens]PRX51547.1 mRNA interferase RelE/StbE [Salegentibacter salegens]SHM86999.1 mRNA-degrading endonuclease RelE, toxin component of the RelBE toxin-antitoxin system [Salegentibacter salegens]